jgi:hypothetical protein
VEKDKEKKQERRNKRRFIPTNKGKGTGNFKRSLANRGI